MERILPMNKKYFFCPRGPIVIKSEKVKIESIIEFLFNEIQKIAQNENIIFLRFEPTFQFQTSDFKFPIFQTLDVEPSKTLILDLRKSEEELLKEMHQKTRYNIKLAEKKEIKLIEADINYFEDFWQLISQTSERDNFRLHGRDYYCEMIKINNKILKLFFVKYKNKLITTGIFSFFGDTVIFLHGASANFDRNIMAPFFLHWQCIKLAKSLGYNFYDFNGIDETRWPGVTRFKKGFGKNIIYYSGTFDLVIDHNWYNVYKMIRKIRRTF